MFSVSISFLDCCFFLLHSRYHFSSPFRFIRFRLAPTLLTFIYFLFFFTFHLHCSRSQLVVSGVCILRLLVLFLLLLLTFFLLTISCCSDFSFSTSCIHFLFLYSCSSRSSPAIPVRFPFRSLIIICCRSCFLSSVIFHFLLLSSSSTFCCCV